MSLVSVLSCLYFIFTIVLLFNKDKARKLFIPFGASTLIFIYLYSSVPVIDVNLQGVIIFISFTLMLMLFGSVFGITTLLFNKSNKKQSIVASIISICALMLFLFNWRGYLSYGYVPVLMYVVQKYIWNYMNGLAAESK